MEIFFRLCRQLRYLVQLTSFVHTIRHCFGCSAGSHRVMNEQIKKNDVEKWVNQCFWPIEKQQKQKRFDRFTFSRIDLNKNSAKNELHIYGPHFKRRLCSHPSAIDFSSVFFFDAVDLMKSKDVKPIDHVLKKPLFSTTCHHLRCDHKSCGHFKWWRWQAHNQTTKQQNQTVHWQ